MGVFTFHLVSVCWKKCQLKVYISNSHFLVQTLEVLEQLQKWNVILFKKKILLVVF